jgi:Leucine-rich repeat (LRR) protein
MFFIIINYSRMSIPDYTITELDLSSKGLNKLQYDIHKYTNLKKLDCTFNKITSLDNLPPNLQILYCSKNQLTSLDNLPLNIKKLKYYFLYYFLLLILE